MVERYFWEVEVTGSSPVIHTTKLLTMDGILSIVDGKIKINDKVFEHHELLEVKQYIKQSNFDRLNFYPESDEEVELLQEITLKMRDISPEALDDSVESYYLN